MEINHFINHLVKNFDVQSIICYGSYAQNMHDAKSDIDLLVLMKNIIPTQVARKNTYDDFHHIKIISLDEDIASRWDVSWTPVNDRLALDKQPIDIGFNTISWVNIIIDKLIVDNQITFNEFPFRPYTFLGLLESCKILYDQDDFIKNCLKQIRPMPLELKKAIINSYLPILRESYEDLVDCSKRDIGILAQEFYLFRGIDAAIGILFAINEAYDPASKRTEKFLFKLKKLPPNLDKFITSTLPRFYENREEVIHFFQECIRFIANNID